MAERVPATRHVTSAFLSGWIRLDVRDGRAPPDPDVVPGAWDALFADLDAHPPKVVVDTSPSGYRGYDRLPVSAFPRLASWLQAGYERAEAAGRSTIYVRRSIDFRPDEGRRYVVRPMTGLPAILGGTALSERPVHIVRPKFPPLTAFAERFQAALSSGAVTNHGPTSASSRRGSRST